MFVAGASGQLYRSSDAGLTWVPANTGLPIVNLNALTIDPQDGTLFVALDLGGIYTSANGGGSWTRVSSGAIEAVQILALVFDESSGALFAGTNGGLYRSSNRGVNWQRVDQGFTSAFVNRVVVQPLSSGSSVVVASVLNRSFRSLANAVLKCMSLPMPGSAGCAADRVCRRWVRPRLQRPRWQVGRYTLQPRTEFMFPTTVGVVGPLPAPG